jgi:hypothetical protein
MNSKYSLFQSFSNLITFKTLKQPVVTIEVLNRTEVKLTVINYCYSDLLDHDTIYDINYPQYLGDPHFCSNLIFEWREDKPVYLMYIILKY